MQIRRHNLLDLVCGADDLSWILEQILARLVVLDEVGQNPGSSLVLMLLSALHLEIEGGVHDKLVPLEGLPVVDLAVLDTNVSVPLQEEHDIGGHDGMAL